MAQPTYEVHLAVYDLSRGMARSLSGQFLGPDHALDIIPHTGLVVYGQEYFFGGGIQSESPQLFRQATGMFPISTESLGRTTVTKDEFEAWCRNCMANGRFTMESYDLMERNCNNFCQEAAVEGLRLPNGIPQWILDVPRRFLASPMGQMIRPMLEGMQVTGGHNANGTSNAPFANAAPPVATAAATPTPAPADHNPWVNLPSSSTTNNNATTHTAAASQEVAATPVLDSYTRPLLSNDAKTATLCANKLIAKMDDETDKTALQDVAKALVTGKVPCDELVDASSQAIFTHLEAGENVTFALMLFRLIVLHPPKNDNDESNNDGAFAKCLEWIQQQQPCSKSSSSGTLSSPAARSMAWCTLSNAYGACPKTITSAQLEAYVEAAMGDLVSENQSRVEVRQAAAAFLYNVSLAMQHEEEEQDSSVDDLQVSMLCACLDGVALETDETTKLRRLVVASKIVKPNSESVVNGEAKALVVDLGFAESLREIVAAGNGKPTASGDVAKLQQVTTEFLSILEN